MLNDLLALAWNNFYARAKDNKVTYSVIGGAISILLMLFFVPVIYGQTLNQINSKDLVYLTNQERLKQNLPTLMVNPQLERAALNKAENLLTEQYFSHNSPEGKKFSDWVKEQGYVYTIVGENLATGFANDQAVINAWMNSPKHRANILQPQYKEIGIAVIKGKTDDQETIMIVQEFGATEAQIISENLFPTNSWLNSVLNYSARV